jgi:hypothetical protein
MGWAVGLRDAAAARRWWLVVVGGALRELWYKERESGDLAAEGGEGACGGVVGGGIGGVEGGGEDGLGRRERERVVGQSARGLGLWGVVGAECSEHIGHGAVERVNGLSEGREAGEGDRRGAVEAEASDHSAHVGRPVKRFAVVGVDEVEGADGSEALDEGFIRGAEVKVVNRRRRKLGEASEGCEEECVAPEGNAGGGEGVAQTLDGGADGLGGVIVVGEGVEEEVEAEEAQRWIGDGEADGVDTGGR